MKNQVKLRYKILNRGIDKNHIFIKMIVYFDNKNGLKIENTRFYIDDDSYIDCKLHESKGVMPRTKRMQTVRIFSFDLSELLETESRINGTLRVVTDIEGQEVIYYIKEKKKRNSRNNKFYYLPECGVFKDGFAVFFRHSYNAALVSVKRKMEEIEYTKFFRFIESKPVSMLLYCLGNIRTALRKKQINIYYEKFCSKAEEGTFELFQLSQQSRNSKNYFIIDENSSDYQRIINEPNVVRRFSFKYYWLIYGADNFISTETPDGHLNVLRSTNYYMMKKIYKGKFVFLQHGVTYMKRHAKTSSFLKGKAGEPDLMAVGSIKEKAICMEMMNLDDSVFMITGLPIYSLVNYKHINQESEDYVMVMLTWKPYEEHLYDFRQSKYYENITKIAKVLEKYISREKIIVVGHPKINKLLESSELGIKLWKKPISEALSVSKLLITDYSSVCYNTFYQGGGVIFYQPDLERYEREVGPLIPKDNEYIGHRVFGIKELETLIEQTISNGKIDLSEVRNDEFEKIHLTINSFNDGKNIERIYKELSDHKIV